MCSEKETSYDSVTVMAIMVDNMKYLRGTEASNGGSENTQLE